MANVNTSNIPSAFLIVLKPTRITPKDLVPLTARQLSLNDGKSYFVLKSDVRSRCTVTSGDSSGVRSSGYKVGNLEHYSHVLLDTIKRCRDDAHRGALVKLLKVVALGQELPRSDGLKLPTYEELQIHGQMVFARDIQHVIVSKEDFDRVRPQIEEFSKMLRVPCYRIDGKLMITI